MVYNKEYYEKNKEKLQKYRREWNRKHYKPRNTKFSERARKAWETRKNKKDI